MMKQQTEFRLAGADAHEASTAEKELNGEPDDAPAGRENGSPERDACSEKRGVASSKIDEQETGIDTADAECGEASAEAVKRWTNRKVACAEPREAPAEKQEEATQRQVAIAEAEGALGRPSGVLCRFCVILK